MKAWCHGPNGCGYNSKSCMSTRLSKSCGKPLVYIASSICRKSPKQCKQTQGLYTYMNKWASGSTCGATTKSYCHRGTSRIRGYVLCVHGRK